MTVSNHRRGPLRLLLAFALLGAASAAAAETTPQRIERLLHAHAQDPAAAEQALHAELRALDGQPLDAAAQDALQLLVDLPPSRTVPHPEGHGLELAEFPVAREARRLLALQAQREIAAASAEARRRGGAEWLAGLRSTAAPGTWTEAGRSAAKSMDSALQKGLQQCADSEPRCAAAVLLDWQQFSDATVAAALDGADPAQAVRFVQQLAQAPATEPRAATLLALADSRPQLAGLATQAADPAAGRLLELLADPLRGADAAAVLAAQLDGALLQQLQARFEASADPLEQQRLLLVLRLASRPDAAARLEHWLGSTALLPQARAAVASW